MITFFLVLSVIANCLSYDEFDTNMVFEENYNPDAYLTAPQIIRRHGYQSESHVVETADGYLLTVHRIPKNKVGRSGQQPVLIQHGLLSSSADFLITGDNKSLAFILSDLGYDVWLGNARGNTYSKAHVSLSTASVEFWNFTAGVVKEKSSIGFHLTDEPYQVNPTCFPFANSSNKFVFKQMNIDDKQLSLAFQQAITVIAEPCSPDWIVKHLGIKQYLPYDLLMKVLSRDCEHSEADKIICDQLIFLVCGFDKYQFDKKLLPLVLGHSPAGTSIKTVIHYTQEIHYHGNFMQFDYGKNGNMVQYGNWTPPDYEINNINVPTYFMYADNDWVANEYDVKKLVNGVNNSIGVYRIPYKLFNHLDFIWAKDAPKLVYKKLIDVIKEYS
ncbi:hypothetical protein FQR65_LT02372 [Abscondita terminalis]|nr:hypothetical protein FQR65_LT02372 [Abscondita terminalis]